MAAGSRLLFLEAAKQALTRQASSIVAAAAAIPPATAVPSAKPGALMAFVGSHVVAAVKGTPSGSTMAGPARDSAAVTRQYNLMELHLPGAPVAVYMRAYAQEDSASLINVTMRLMLDTGSSSEVRRYFKL
jgi:hypothetical protein